MVKTFVRLLAVAGSLSAQIGPVDGGFEAGGGSGVPEAWSLAPGAAESTYTMAIASAGCKQGNGCMVLKPRIPAGDSFVNVLQRFDGTAYRSKEVSVSVAARLEPGPGFGAAFMWMRVDRPGGKQGFYEGMQNRPIIRSQWEYYQFKGLVHPDADHISVGFIVRGGATAYFDDLTVTITGDMPALIEAPASPLSENGLSNLIAFAELFGLVRFFHPSDQVAAADWNALAIAGARKVENAKNPAELAELLDSFFKPMAPAIRVFAGTAPPASDSLSAPAPSLQITSWSHKGVGLGNPNNIYRSTRVKRSPASGEELHIHEVSIGNGVKALVPAFIVYGREWNASSGACDERRHAHSLYSGADRGTRLGNVVNAWTVFKHFYPYFDVVKTDWEAVLPAALKQAAVDNDELAFASTLKRMVAALRDGHGAVSYGGGALFRPRFNWDLIERKLTVTNPGEVAALKAGDEVVSVNGKPALDVLREREELASGATAQWIHYRGLISLLSGSSGEKLTLEILPFGDAKAAPRSVEVICGPTGMPLPHVKRPAPIAELEPGIRYVDLTRASDADFTKSLPDLEAAKGIIFDMRGYPRVSPAWFSHVSEQPLRSAQWHVPLVTQPGKMEFERGGEWNLPPKTPYLKAKRVFLTDGTAISYAESTMGIVEHYKLGEIVGETTAGTNGNVNPFTLPGGYSISWTGMKVLKHDGTQHHGVGIKATIPAVRTRAGVAAGRDEVLERGIEVLKKSL